MENKLPLILAIIGIILLGIGAAYPYVIIYVDQTPPEITSTVPASGVTYQSLDAVRARVTDWESGMLLMLPLAVTATYPYVPENYYTQGYIECPDGVAPIFVLPISEKGVVITRVQMVIKPPYLLFADLSTPLYVIYYPAYDWYNFRKELSVLEHGLEFNVNYTIGFAIYDELGRQCSLDTWVIFVSGEAPPEPPPQAVCTMQIDGGAWVAMEELPQQPVGYPDVVDYGATITPVAEGSHTYTVEAMNKAGLTTTESGSFTIYTQLQGTWYINDQEIISSAQEIYSPSTTISFQFVKTLGVADEYITCTIAEGGTTLTTLTYTAANTWQGNYTFTAGRHDIDLKAYDGSAMIIFSVVGLAIPGGGITITLTLRHGFIILGAVCLVAAVIIKIKS